MALWTTSVTFTLIYKRQPNNGEHFFFSFLFVCCLRNTKSEARKKRNPTRFRLALRPSFWNTVGTSLRCRYDAGTFPRCAAGSGGTGRPADWLKRFWICILAEKNVMAACHARSGGPCAGCFRARATARACPGVFILWLSCPRCPVESGEGSGRLAAATLQKAR